MTARLLLDKMYPPLLAYMLRDKGHDVLERSLAGCLLAAAHRTCLTWCVGVRPTPPLTVHAWAATGHAPVAETIEVNQYRNLFTV